MTNEDNIRLTLIDAFNEWREKKGKETMNAQDFSEFVKGVAKELVGNKKTASIEFDSLKCTDGWHELGNDLGFSDKKINEVFEYGEYGHVRINCQRKP